MRAALLFIAVFGLLHNHSYANVPFGCDIQISGEIDDTNTSRLLKFMSEKASSGGGTICLDSPGGSIDNALKIVGRMDRMAKQSFGLTTFVRNGSRCESACAVIFMAGYHCDYRGYCRINRYMQPRAKIGFHAPYPKIDGNINEQTFRKAYGSAVKHIQRLIRMNNHDAFAGGPPRIQASLIAQLLVINSDKLLYIKNIYDAITNHIYLIGNFKNTIDIKKPFLNNINYACANYVLQNRRMSEFKKAKEVSYMIEESTENIKLMLVDGSRGQYIYLKSDAYPYVWRHCLIPVPKKEGFVKRVRVREVGLIGPPDFEGFVCDSCMFASDGSTDQIVPFPQYIISSGKARRVSRHELFVLLRGIVRKSEYWLFYHPDQRLAELSRL